MKCSYILLYRKPCEKPAVFTYHWPEGGGKGVCAEHAKKLEEIANETHRLLTLTPVETKS